MIRLVVFLILIFPSFQFASSKLISSVASESLSIYAGETGIRGLSDTLLYRPSALAINQIGEILIADTYNNRVVKKDANGHLQSVTPPDVMNSPYGCAFDSRSNLYICDYRNHMIHRLDLSSGTMRPFAGTGFKNSCGRGSFNGDGHEALKTSISFPHGIACDGLDNVYFSDSGNHRVRKIDFNTNVRYYFIPHTHSHKQ